MKLEYTLTPKDYKAGFGLHRRQRIIRRIVPWFGPCLLLIAFIGFIVFSVKNNSAWAAQCIALAVGALVITIGLPISRFINIRKGYRRLFPSGSHDRKSSIEINDVCIVREHSGASELKIPWNAVYGFAQDERVTMIYTNKDCFLLFPTHVMSPEQRAELGELVARHGVKS